MVISSQTRNSILRFSTLLLSVFITLNATLFYGFVTTKVFFVVASVILIAYFLMDYKNVLILSLSFFFMTIVLNGFLSIESVETIVYRYKPIDRIITYNPEMGTNSYKRNVRIETVIPFGDIYMIGTEKNIDIEPRKVIIKTDSLGFRNDNDYHNEKYILVGDSFIVGANETQENMLASQLYKYNISSYTLAYPGDIPEYVQFISYFQKKYRGDYRVLLFVFEGNDFQDKYSKNQQLSIIKNLLATYRGFFKTTKLYGYTYSLQRTFEMRNWPSHMTTINGNKIGILDSYADFARRNSFVFSDEIVSQLSTVSNKIEHIFFIPVKYRVYYSMIQNNEKGTLPDAQWKALEILARRLNIQCTDLTGPMIEESKRLIKKNTFTYWKDDTHWNKFGVAVAASVINSKIKSGEIK
jgi:hypothetical protein